MTRYVAGRLAQGALVVLGASLITFAMVSSASWKLLQVTVNDGRRRELLNQLQDLMLDDPPVVLLHKPVDIYGMSRDLDWTQRPGQRFNLFKRR